MKLISEPAEISGNALLFCYEDGGGDEGEEGEDQHNQLSEEEDGVGHREGGRRGFLSTVC